MLNLSGSAGATAAPCDGGERKQAPARLRAGGVSQRSFGGEEEEEEEEAEQETVSFLGA